MQIHDYKMFVNLSFFGLIKECLLGLGKPCSVVFCISNFSSDPWYVGIYTYTSTWSVQGQKCLKLWVKSDIHINEWNQICTCTCLGSLKITETLKSLVRFRITLMLILYRLNWYMLYANHSIFAITALAISIFCSYFYDNLIHIKVQSIRLYKDCDINEQIWFYSR